MIEFLYFHLFLMDFEIQLHLKDDDERKKSVISDHSEDYRLNRINSF